MRVPSSHTPVADPGGRVALCLAEVGYTNVHVVVAPDGSLSILGPVPPPPDWQGIVAAFEKACRLVCDAPHVDVVITLNDAWGRAITPVVLPTDWGVSS